MFYGRDTDYASTPWNDPHQIGYAFGCRVNISGDAGEAMTAFWIRFSERVFTLLDKSAAGVTGDEAADFQCAVEIEEARYALVGLALTAD